jgi:hypothetical protein
LSTVRRHRGASDVTDYQEQLRFIFDKAFDDGSVVTSYLDLNKARRIKQQYKRMNVDFPVWMINSLDKEATRLGVSRQSVIKVWLEERIERRRLADECAKLDPVEERQLAEEGMNG